MHVCMHTMYTHTHTHTGTHTHEHSDYTKLNLHSLKQAAYRLEMDEDSSTEQKTWHVMHALFFKFSSDREQSMNRSTG